MAHVKLGDSFTTISTAHKQLNSLIFTVSFTANYNSDVNIVNVQLVSN